MSEEGKFGQWIDATKHLPEVGRWVLVVYDDIVSVDCSQGGLHWIRHPNCREDPITHWMPLPELPRRKMCFREFDAKTMVVGADEIIQSYKRKLIEAMKIDAQDEAEQNGYESAIKFVERWEPEEK